MPSRVLTTSQGFPAALTSGTAYHSTDTGDASVSLSVVLASTLGNTSAVVVDVSEDGSSWIEATRASCGGLLLTITLPMQFRVPQGWYYRVTASGGATIGNQLAWY